MYLEHEDEDETHLLHWSIHPGEQPQVVTQDCLKLVFDGGDSKKLLKRFASWRGDVESTHQFMFPGYNIPAGISSFKTTERVSRDETLFERGTSPLSMAVAIFATAAQRNRPDRNLKVGRYFCALLDRLVNEIPPQGLQWQRIGDNRIKALAVQDGRVQGQVVWTSHAWNSMVSDLLDRAANDYKPWLNDLTYESPKVSSLIMFCLDSVVFKKQPILRMHACSLLAQLSTHLCNNLVELTGSNSNLPAGMAMKRMPAHLVLALSWQLQKQVRQREVSWLQVF